MNGATAEPCGQYQQPADQHHHDDDRGQPEFLALPHELPEVLQQIDHQNGFSRLSRGGFSLAIRYDSRAAVELSAQRIVLHHAHDEPTGTMTTRISRP